MDFYIEQLVRRPAPSQNKWRLIDRCLCRAIISLPAPSSYKEEVD